MKNLIPFIYIVLIVFGGHGVSNGQMITTFAGNNVSGYSGDNGPATVASFDFPAGIAFDASGNLFVADEGNNVIREIRRSDSFIIAFAGNGYGHGTGGTTVGYGGYTGDGGTDTAAELFTPFAVAFDSSGNAYIADTRNNVIRKVNSAGIISNFAGNNTQGYLGDNGAATAAELNQPAGLVFDNAGNLYISDYGNSAIRKVSASGTISTYAGTGVAGYSGDGGAATVAMLNLPWGVAIDTADNLYIAESGSHVIRKVNAGSGIIQTFAGIGNSAAATGDGGAATDAKLNAPSGVAVDDTGNVLIADQKNNIVRKVSAVTGIITTIAGTGVLGFSGDGDTATHAQLNSPSAIAVDRATHNIYIADESNMVIRVLTPFPPVPPPNGSGVHSVPGIASEILDTYPNPNKGVFTVHVTSNATESVQLTVTDILGETVKQQNSSTNQNINIQLDEPQGIYFLTAITAHGNWKQEIVVLR